MTVTAANLRSAIANALDFLLDRELAVAINPLRHTGDTVTWAASEPFGFLPRSATIEEYLDWVRTRQYCAILFDGSLLQLSYTVADGVVSKHRLAYVPCPVLDTEDLLRTAPVADVVEIYVERHRDNVKLRSPLRFDLDMEAGSEAHPDAHFTLNDPSCRIGCVAAVHPLRFIDFVFRHFYPSEWAAEQNFFSEAETRTLGTRLLDSSTHGPLHLAWRLDKLAA